MLRADGSTNVYKPDSVSPPGASLSDLIQERGLNQAELARRMGRPRKTINEIIRGRAEITEATALELERVLGTPASFWLARERNYREHLARESASRLFGQWREWAQGFPVREMVKRGWIEPARSPEDRVAALLSFFGVASRDAWADWWFTKQAAFRRSGTATVKPEALAVWLRRTEIEAERRRPEAFNRQRFIEALSRIRALTLDDDLPGAVERAERTLLDAGVILLVVQELPGVPVSGATWWASGSRAIVALTLRYKTDDQLWFSMFHEAHHVLEQKTRQVFVDLADGDGREESKANEFAADFLLSRDSYLRFVAHGDFSCGAIERLALTQGVAPGIAVGRLQHDGHIEFSRCDHLKRRLKWLASGMT